MAAFHDEADGKMSSLDPRLEGLASVIMITTYTYWGAAINPPTKSDWRAANVSKVTEKADLCRRDEGSVWQVTLLLCDMSGRHRRKPEGASEGWFWHTEAQPIRRVV